jgi:hypothetical protein
LPPRQLQPPSRQRLAWCPASGCISGRFAVIPWRVPRGGNGSAPAGSGTRAGCKGIPTIREIHRNPLAAIFQSPKITSEPARRVRWIRARVAAGDHGRSGLRSRTRPTRISLARAARLIAHSHPSSRGLAQLADFPSTWAFSPSPKDVPSSSFRRGNAARGPHRSARPPRPSRVQVPPDLPERT